MSPRGGARPGAGRPRTGQMPSIQVRIPKADLEAIDLEALVRKISRSAVIRDAAHAWAVRHIGGKPS